LNQFEDFVKPGGLSIQPKIDSIGGFRGGLWGGGYYETVFYY
jgi:hypothetical protein